MNIDDLTLKGKQKLLKAIASGILNQVVANDDEETITDLLNVLVDELDRLDCYDGIGTEGWRENFGVAR